MSGLGRKLSRLTGVGARPKPTTDDDGRFDAFGAALRSDPRGEVERPRERQLPGRVLERAAGRLRCIERRLALDEGHAGVPFRAVLLTDPGALARFALDPSLASVDPARMVFLDTETTGLYGGAGTVPFLVGVVRFEGGHAVVERWLLERFGEEAPLLARLAEVLAEASALVTFNGKSFDWPLLRARYVLHRMTPPTLPPHLDLLHGARRVLRSQLASVRAVEVERHVLGFEREGDLDASLIPAIFFDVARGGHPPLLEAALHHHELDLLGMVALTARFGQLFAGTLSPERDGDALGVARVVARAGADDVHRALVTGLLDGVDDVEAYAIKAVHARKARDVDAEVRALRVIAERAEPGEVAARALLALATCLERRVGDLEAACAAAQRALSHDPSDRASVRVARLERRLARRSGPRASARGIG